MLRIWFFYTEIASLVKMLYSNRYEFVQKSAHELDLENEMGTWVVNNHSFSLVINFISDE